MLTQNYAATAKEFGVNESTVRTIVKTPMRNGELNDKGNHSGAGSPAGNCMFKVNNRNTRTRCEICSKLTIKTPERRLASFWCLYC